MVKDSQAEEEECHTNGFESEHSVSGRFSISMKSRSCQQGDRVPESHEHQTIWSMSIRRTFHFTIDLSTSLDNESEHERSRSH